MCDNYSYKISYVLNTDTKPAGNHAQEILHRCGLATTEYNSLNTWV